ncbi:MAG: MMPL family transporter [Actinomycetota bacterium]
MNLAGRMGRWSAHHWKTATILWLVFVVLAVGAGRAVGTFKLKDSEQATGEAARAQAILSSAGFKSPASESVLVESRTGLSAGSPAFRATVRDVAAALKPMPQVQNLRSGLAGQVSKDGKAELVQFEVLGGFDKGDKHVQPVLDKVAALQRSHPQFTVAEFGIASSNHELNKTVGKDFQKAEQLSLPITFLILLFAFGAFVAAGVPVLLAFTAVLGSIGLMQLTSHVAHASDATQSVMLLMGMAVGVDYSLFYLKREREERSRGHEGHEGLYRAAATSGQAVLISGVTVLIAMAGMLFAGSKIFVSIGIGAMLVVFTALIGSLTVLPALLGKLGDRIERGIRQVAAAGILRLLPRKPAWLVKLRDTPTLIVRAKGNRHESRIWGVILKRSTRYPLVALLLSGAILVVLALPVFRMHTKLLSFADLPRKLPIIQTYLKIQQEFPGSPAPAHVVVRGTDVTSPQFRRAFAQLEQRALATGQVHQPVEVAVNPAKTVARIDMPLIGNGVDSTSYHALGVLRDDVIPPVLATLPPGTQEAVTGDTAGSFDFNQTMKHRFPYVFAFVLGLAFLLLLLTFRSIVIPIKAIVLNLLSVGAAYGILVWIFQDGHLQGFLGFHSNGAVVSWLPLFLFTVLFGLSMDYHVFILSRVKELVDGGTPTSEAVERGIRTTASTVTSAAVVMVAVFTIFATLSTLDIKQMGVGLAAAVLLDATLIRGVLLPAAMKLLGEWNWYLPSWLQWLPHFNIEPELHEPSPGPPALAD